MIKTLYVKEFSGFSVQFFCGKNVYRFNTVVDAVFNRPYPHIHLMYPKELIANRLRKSQRIVVKIIASMRNSTVSERFNIMQSGRLVDLSLAAAQWLNHTKMGFKKVIPSNVSFKVNLEGQDVMLMVKGFVRSVKAAQAIDGKILFRYGLQFDVLPFQEKIVLQNYIFTALATENAEAI